MSPYKIVRAESLVDLEKLVQKEMSNGMIPIGGVVVAFAPEWEAEVWAQALVGPLTVRNWAREITESIQKP
jgi:hypothetical protein